MDELLTLTMVMQLNNGVLRPRDHPRSRRAFDSLVRDGSIVRVLPGTYVDAARVSERRTRFAAALAATPGSLLWGEDATAALTDELHERPFADGDVVRLAHPQGRRPLPGVRWVRRVVPVAQHVRVNGLRCPSAAYLAVEASVRDSGALIERFLRKGLVAASELPDALACFAGSNGQSVRRKAVRISLDNPWSGGERALLQLLRRRHVSGWVANERLVIGERICYPDVLFAGQRLVVEFDGYAVHSQREVFEADRARQNALVAAGYRVLRFTWKQICDDPDGVIGLIRDVLAREMTTDLAGTQA